MMRIFITFHTDLQFLAIVQARASHDSTHVPEARTTHRQMMKPTFTLCSRSFEIPKALRVIYDLLRVSGISYEVGPIFLPPDR